jgi:hypothetical protein
MQQWFEDRTMPSCRWTLDQQTALTILQQHSTDLWSMVASGDALDIGRGYSSLGALLTVMGSSASASPQERCKDAVASLPFLIGAGYGAGIPADAQPRDVATQPAPKRDNGASVTAPAETRSADAPSDAADAYQKLSGWWRFESNEWGCDDTDNQYRVAIGHWTATPEDKLVFGAGEPRIGLYDGGCSVENLAWQATNVLGFDAQCTFEGEPASGRGRIVIADHNTINVAIPSFREDGLELVSCTSQ